MKKRSMHTPFIREDGPSAERLSGSRRRSGMDVFRDVRKVALESEG